MLATIGGSGHCGTPELWSKLVQAPMLVGSTNAGWWHQWWGPRRGLPTANATFHDRRLPANQPTSILCIPETVTQGLRGVAPHSLAN